MVTSKIVEEGKVDDDLNVVCLGLEDPQRVLESIKCVEITIALLLVSGKFERTPGGSVLETVALVSIEPTDISGT
jgi:hypothetical protein